MASPSAPRGVSGCRACHRFDVFARLCGLAGSARDLADGVELLLNAGGVEDFFEVLREDAHRIVVPTLTLPCW